MADLLGLLLAGGASSRLGKDKASLPLPGGMLSFAEHGRRLLAEAGFEVLIAARDEERAALLLPGCPAVADGPGRGPAAGLLGAWAAFPRTGLLALACDMPAVPPALLRHLAGLDGDWVVPAWREAAGGEPRLEPLCALYRPAALAALERRVAAGAFELRGLAAAGELQVRRVTRGEIERFGPPEAIFANVNRPADLAALAALRQAPCPPD